MEAVILKSCFMEKSFTHGRGWKITGDVKGPKIEKRNLEEDKAPGFDRTSSELLEALNEMSKKNNTWL